LSGTYSSEVEEEVGARRRRMSTRRKMMIMMMRPKQIFQLACEQWPSERERESENRQFKVFRLKSKHQ
jgi:hypothetical protein